MTPRLLAWLKPALFLLVMASLSLAWLVYFHNASVAGHLPQWGWLQGMIHKLGEKSSTAAEEDEDPDTTKNDIPVHVEKAKIATVHRYVDGFGVVGPRPSRKGEMAGGANLASATPGVVAKVLVQEGQLVKAGEPVIQLDDRLAEAAETQAAATLAQAEASLAALKATPRPEQLQIAQLSVEKTQSALQFAQRNYERLKKLAADQGTSTKSVEQAGVDLSSAQTDAAISQKQLTLLQATPTPEDLHQEQAKVKQAEAALASAKRQRQMMTIASPIGATVVLISVNPGESVDVTKTLVQLVAMDRLIVDMDVPADQLPANAEGLAAEVLPSSTEFSEKATPVVAKVAAVSPQVEAKTGTVKVSIDVPANAGMRPGLAVRARIIAEEHKDVVVVPRNAVVEDENGQDVISIVEGDQATHKTVKSGFTVVLDKELWIEVDADGVKEGTTVVTAGVFGLPAASRVKILD